jgi:hypothetical protein
MQSKHLNAEVLKRYGYCGSSPNPSMVRKQ